MSKISVNNVSKRYGYQWIIRNLNVDFQNNQIFGISGNNGSGKSTLIKMLSGYLSPSQGSISYIHNNTLLTRQEIFKHLTLAAPYTDLINEYTLKEMFAFHCKFKPIANDIDFKTFESIIELPGQSSKTLLHFSSGMKQKIQIALAVLSDTPFLLLDEPTSYLDKIAKNWFANLIQENRHNKLVLLASNDGFDIELCDKVLVMGEDKLR